MYTLKLEYCVCNNNSISSYKHVYFSVSLIFCPSPLSQVLWPFLIEFLVPPAYTNALGIVARCVTDIATEKRQNNVDEYDLNYEELG